ncbi:hypothetical protein [Fastidiosibacter lacustris]|uniref:hypothetical protein n=1 Tax=Fastidiosibacter lacustris TaxID=2056695 RepID=UPI000E34DFD2|nr:hypothetical protein [Fastidiosibacter lacustris]
MNHQIFNLTTEIDVKTKAEAGTKNSQWRVFSQHFIEQSKLWLVALCFVMVVMMLMTGFSYAGNKEIIVQIDTVTGPASWIQKMFAVGALVSGLIVMFVQKHIVLGIGIIGSVWGALAVYNAGLF